MLDDHIIAIELASAWKYIAYQYHNYTTLPYSQVPITKVE